MWEKGTYISCSQHPLALGAELDGYTGKVSWSVGIRRYVLGVFRHCESQKEICNGGGCQVRGADMACGTIGPTSSTS